MQKVKIYSDGAARGNPDGPGGYGTVVKYLDDNDIVTRIDEFTGGSPITTNNRMELTAVIRALQALKKECRITLYTDSRYVMDGVMQWLPNWKVNGWRTANKKTPVKNVDLWQELESLLEKHQIKWVWVKGHNGHPENERVDKLARDEAKSRVLPE